jgi:hypothetical protein
LFAVTTLLPARSASVSHDHDVHVVPFDQAERVRGEQGRVDSAPVAAEPPHGDADDLQRGADPGREVGGLLRHQPHDLRADGAATEQRDLDRVSHRSHSP